MTTKPCAKINIGLDILRRRTDGFHDIETLMVPYRNLCDTLTIEESAKFKIEIIKDGRLMDGSVPGEWDPRKDLTVKAWQLLRKDFDLPPVAIHLEKGIPVGAGLGGGSADATFALRMLSEMFDLYLPDEMLEIYAAELGSDCAFFVHDGAMFASGRGEVLEMMEIPALEELRAEVVVPEGISVSTKEAYSAVVPQEVRTLPLREALKLPAAQWKGSIGNDFEKGVFALHPTLAEIKEDFYRRGAVYAAMSGSGSAVFGLFENN